MTGLCEPVWVKFCMVVSLERKLLKRRTFPVTDEDEDQDDDDDDDAEVFCPNNCNKQPES